MGALFGAWYWVCALLAFLVIIPLFVWSIFKFGESLIQATLELLFCAGFGWLWVSLLQYSRARRRFGSGIDPREILSSPRPTDPDEYLLWKWTRHYAITWIVMAVGMLITVAVLVLFYS